MKRILWRDIFFKRGAEQIRYDVHIDGEIVEAMARKAAASKTGKCTDGPLQVVITNRQKLDLPPVVGHGGIA